MQAPQHGLTTPLDDEHTRPVGGIERRTNFSVALKRHVHPGADCEWLAVQVEGRTSGQAQRQKRSQRLIASEQPAKLAHVVHENHAVVPLESIVRSCLPR